MNLVNKIKKGVLVATTLGILASPVGCARTTPTVYSYPKPNQASEQFYRDKFECEQWARSQIGTDPSAEATKSGATDAFLLGALGALVGGLAGSGWNDAGIGAAIGGGAGAIEGGLKGSEAGQDRFNRAYQACMESKGYIVK